MSKTRDEKLIDMFSGELDMALKRRAILLINELNPKKNDRILDAGCGWGYYLNLISKLDLDTVYITGIDSDKKALNKIKKNIKYKNLDIHLGGIEKMPFKDKSFDKVLLSEVLEHLPDDLKVLKEIKRVLKRGGVVLITVPNSEYPLFWDPVNWILEHFLAEHIKKGFWRGIWTNHTRLYSVDRLLSKVKSAGFKVECVSTLTSWCIPFNVNLLYGGKFSPSFSNSFLKNLNKNNKPWWARIILFSLNTFDKLNDILPSKKVGVGIFLKAEKI